MSRTQPNFDFRMLALILCAASCEKAFPRFVKKYRKFYPTEELRQTALKNFCLHYNISKSYPHNNLQINELSDLGRPPVSGYIKGKAVLQHYTRNLKMETGANDIETYNRPAPMKALAEAVCKNQVGGWTSYANYSAEDILSGDLPQAVDLRKISTIQSPYDQGTCGSCYAQSTRYVMHSLFVHDILHYYYHPKFASYFANINNKVKFSVQFIMNHTFGSNQYCAGGNFITVANDFLSGRIPSLQYESDFPYEAMMDSDKAPPLETPIRPEPKSDFSKDELLNPTHWLNDDYTADCPQGVINIDLKEKSGYKLLKAILARGIAVAGHQYVPEDYVQALKYSMYKSGVIRGSDYPCPDGDPSNHQVTFVGYGTYKGEPVWVIQNSWGSSWGMRGTGYFSQKDNPMCVAVDAQAVLPRYLGYDLTLESLDKPFNQSQLYAKAVEKGLISDIYPQIKWGYSGLDSFVNGEIKYVSEKLSPMAWIVIVAIAALILVCLYFACVCLLRPPPNEVMIPQYLMLDPKNAQFIPWDKGVSASHVQLTIANSATLHSDGS